MTLFPQRRGRGKSGGDYGEGLASDGSGYSCDAAIAGFERAVDDPDAVMRHLRGWPDVDQSRLAIGGVSRGGILSIAYAGMPPAMFQGAINFNGRWLGRGCATHEAVNPVLSSMTTIAGPLLEKNWWPLPCRPCGRCKSHKTSYGTNILI